MSSENDKPEAGDYALPPLNRPLRVLVADDGRVDRRIVTAILERRGHTVAAVDDGAKALARLKEAEEQQTPFDVAVLDLHMPGMDGCEVVTWIRAYEETEKKESPLLVIALSGAASESDWWRGKGVNHFLSKPVDPLRLTATVEGWSAGMSTDSGAAPEQSERVVFDLGEALTRARGKKPLLAELIQIFLEDAAVQMESLQAAIKEGDLGRIERSAHRLKGSALNVSAQRVADVAEKMEMRVRAGQAGASTNLWNPLETEVGHARRALAGFLTDNCPPESLSPATAALLAAILAPPAPPAPPPEAAVPEIVSETVSASVSAPSASAPQPVAPSGELPSSVPSFLQ